MISRLVSILVFLLGAGVLTLSCGLALADADGPDYWAVQGLTQQNVLNLRKGPALEFLIIAQIPANFSHLENLGCSPAFTDKEWMSFTQQERALAVSLRWCRVQYNGHTGWVKGIYLQEGVPPKE